MYRNHLLLVQLGWKHDADAIWYLVASGHIENAWTYVDGGCIYYHTFIFDHTRESWGNGICCTAAVHCQYCRCLAKMIEWIASFETFLKRSTEKSEWTSSFPSFPSFAFLPSGVVQSCGMVPQQSIRFQLHYVGQFADLYWPKSQLRLYMIAYVCIDNLTIWFQWLMALRHGTTKGF